MTPCGKCPFRTDLEPYLRAERAQEIREVLENGGTFHCHETVDYPDDTDEGRVTDQSEFCAGAMILMEHQGGAHMNQYIRILTRISDLDLDKLNMRAPVFRDWDDWVEAQA